MSSRARALPLSGAIALGFGLGSFYATGSLGTFAAANLGLGVATLAVSGIAAARRKRGAIGPHTRPVLVRGALRLVVALLVAIALERGAATTGIEIDFTAEGRYELAEATLAACRAVAPVRATLFSDPEDPRVRRTRTLLAVLERRCDLEIREQSLDVSAELEDRYAIASSNTVVVESGGRFETVGRPSEGTLFEALYRLRSVASGVVTLLRGGGEGDPGDESDLGYSGLAAALETEGYSLQSAVSGALDAVPRSTDVLLAIAPRRRLPDPSLDAVRDYLSNGGRLVVLLEPGLGSGLEEILAEYGLSTPDGVLVDPSLAGNGGSGVEILSGLYESHPVTRGLSSNRMTFYPGARTFQLRKPRGEDRIQRLAVASHRSWMSDDLSLLEGRGRLPERIDQRQDYHPLAVAGSYERHGRNVRIVAFGDSDFASNRHLRTLYNLDIAVNAVHWAAAREPEITLRPKIRSLIQFPLPIQNTLQTLYGVGLLVPEVILIAGCWVWLNRR